MNKNLFLSQEDRYSEESPLIYKWAKPVTALKAKRDADGFIAPWAMFRPLGDKGLFSAMLGENAVRRAADLRLNRDLLLKEIYEHEIEQLMCRIRLSEIETQQKFAKEDREMELYQRAEASISPRSPRKRLGRSGWMPSHGNTTLSSSTKSSASSLQRRSFFESH